MTVKARIAIVSILALVAVTGCAGDEVAEKAATMTVAPTGTATATQTVTVPAETEDAETAGRTQAPPPAASTGPSGEPTVPSGGLGKTITLAEAVAAARQSASEYLTMSAAGFRVEPGDWQVSCAGRPGRRVWTCRVRQGPCSGTLAVRRVTIGGQIRGVGRVGCVAD